MLCPRRPNDPVLGCGGDLAGIHDCAWILRVRRSCRDVGPLLGDLLHVPVEGGRHLEPARVDLLAVVGGLGAEDQAELVADLPDEMRRSPADGDLLDQLHRLVLGGVVFRDRVVVAAERAPCLHQVEDVVPTLRRSRSPRGTTSLNFVHSAPSATSSRHSRSAFRTRSKRVGDCGIAARIATWARVSSSSGFPK